MKKIVIISAIIGFISFSVSAQTSTQKLNEKKTVTSRSSVLKAVDQNQTLKETQTTTTPENKISETNTTSAKTTTPTTTTTTTTSKCQQSTQGTNNTNCTKICPHSGMKCSAPCHQNMNKTETKTVVPKQ